MGFGRQNDCNGPAGRTWTPFAKTAAFPDEEMGKRSIDKLLCSQAISSSKI
jgi:hypothetical protein